MEGGIVPKRGSNSSAARIQYVGQVKNKQPAARRNSRYNVVNCAALHWDVVGGVVDTAPRKANNKSGFEQ
eukprot:737397-Pyramimonas_sp.AAC.1